MNNYEIIDTIGAGAFGRVYKAIRVSDGKLIALKQIRVMEQNKIQFNLIKAEIENLIKVQQNCDSMFVICYYDSYYDKPTSTYFIEMEYIKGVTLTEYMNINQISSNKSNRNYLNNIIAIARDVAVGLKYIHSKGIIHNDIKLENIMIQDDTNIPKIIDFGISCMINLVRDGEKACMMRAGTPMYMSPETIEKSIRYPASDMWALGISLYIMATGEYPYDFELGNRNSLANNILTQEPPRLNSKNYTLNRIVNRLLVKDPSNRMSADNLISMVDKNIETWISGYSSGYSSDYSTNGAKSLCSTSDQHSLCSTSEQTTEPLLLTQTTEPLLLTQILSLLL